MDEMTMEQARQILAKQGRTIEQWAPIIAGHQESQTLPDGWRWGRKDYLTAIGPGDSYCAPGQYRSGVEQTLGVPREVTSTVQKRACNWCERHRLAIQLYKLEDNRRWRSMDSAPQDSWIEVAFDNDDGDTVSSVIRWPSDAGELLCWRPFGDELPERWRIEEFDFD